MVQCAAPGLIKRFLRRKKLRQSDAAKQLGVTASALNQYIQEKQRPRADIRQKIARWSGGYIPESAWLTRGERRSISTQILANTSAA